MKKECYCNFPKECKSISMPHLLQSITKQIYRSQIHSPGHLFGQRKLQIPNLTYLSVTECRMAFCQTIAHSRNELGNWVKFENMFTSTPGPCTAFRGGSCCDTEIGWKHNICNVVARCTTTHSKTLKKLHITGLAGDCHGWGGVGMEMGWRWG